MGFVTGALAWLPVILVAAGVVASAIRILTEYERAVVFRLGRLIGAKGPGLVILIPFIDRMRKVDLRVVTLDVPTQEAITHDNVTIRVNAVVYYRVLDPSSAIVAVEDYQRATWQIAQTTLRNVIGQSELDQILSDRDSINLSLQHIIDEATEPWGIKVVTVEVKDVELPDNMKRAMARQAEAERERRSKIIHAEGEFQAAERLADAAKLMSAQPVAVQLRFLQTLAEIATEQNSTIIFPVPVDIINALIRKETDSPPPG